VSANKTKLPSQQTEKRSLKKRPKKKDKKVTINGKDKHPRQRRSPTEECALPVTLTLKQLNKRG